MTEPLKQVQAGVAYMQERYGYPAATGCEVGKYHFPRPARYVHHHVWPVGDGGPNEAENRIESCDAHHYAIHELLDLYRKGPVPWSVRRHYSRGVQKYAALGWDRIKRQAM